MKSKLPLFIGSLFSLYLLFVAFVVIAYEPIADDKDWQDRQAYNLHHIAQLSLGSDIEQIKTLLGGLILTIIATPWQWLMIITFAQ